MPVESITRLRLRSWRFLPVFFFHASRSLGQARSAPGHMHSETRRTSGLAFWTLTRWEDGKAMRAYVGSGAHRVAMAKLARWCDEASYTHWESLEDAPQPSWDQAVAVLREQGTLSRVNHPSARHDRGEMGLD